MTEQINEDLDTTVAGWAHLSALTGPVLPALVWLARRRDDAWAATEAAKATNWGMAVLVSAVAATVVRMYVPFVGFLGTLAQLVVLIVAVFFCVQAHRNVHEGAPATYPFYIKVVKTND